jgi:NAD(P)-dependent dehydrogenase (short-subunit alcohol dehydrogenase family)
MPLPFKDRTVIITGAGKGLGRSYALYLARLGANVVVNNRRRAGQSLSSADETTSAIHAAGGKAVAEYSSVDEPGSGQRMLDTALNAFGSLHGVIANAGVAEGCSFHKQSIEEFGQIITTNLLGTVNVLHPAFRYLYDQNHGSIIVSTSAAGLHGEHGLPAYSASKAALLGLMHSLCIEGAPHQVRVNALAPFATTQMTEASLPSHLHEVMRADRVAPIAAWLVSADCPLTGEIVVCGAGKIGRARMQETAPLVLDTGLEYRPEAHLRQWQEIAARPADRNFRGALEQFRAFIAD